FMLGHGAGSNISRLLGARKVDKAKVFASTSFFLSIFIGAFIMVFGILFNKPLMYLLGSTDTILKDAMTYAFFIFIAGPAMTSGCVLNNLLRYEGKAVFAMIGLTSGGILNMILDPILIYGFKLNIAGAGLATAISQYIATTILMIPFLTNKTVTKIHPQFFTNNWQDITNILFVGSPSFFRQGLNSISISVLNIQASVYGDAAIAAMSVVNRVSNLLFSCALGIGQGFQPVSAFNYGSKKYDRVKQGTIFTALAGTLILTCFCIICYLNAESVISIFRKENEIISIGSQALRYYCIGLCLFPTITTGNMLFQSIGESKKALLLASLQNGLILIPLMSILPSFLGLTGIQIAQPLSYFITFLITLPFLISFLKQLDKQTL
ncbi:MAG: MATE family efflux transporter, partial [Traorella sp.]